MYWTYINATKDRTHPDYPLVILINPSSASASEIVAGALADKMHHRAILVGERTHGKGSVQQISSKPGNKAQLKLTIAYYHLPSGQRVESRDEMKKLGRSDWGVAPNVEVKMGSGILAASDEVRKMLEVRRANEMLVQAGHKASETEKKYTIEETLESDPQLATGLLVVKTKLIDEQNSRLLAVIKQPKEGQPQ
jgi:carboxyl-terminal processing protease